MQQINPKILVKKPGLRSYRPVLLLAGLAFILLSLSSGLNVDNPLESIEYQSFREEWSLFSNPSHVAAPSLIAVSALFLGIAVIKGVQLQWQPDSLSNLPQLDHLPFVKKSVNGKEILLLKLEGGKLQLAWETVTGPPRRWKVNICLEITAKESRDLLRSLAMFILMEENQGGKEDMETGLFYSKICLVREWPRQEYLLNYWLSKKQFKQLKRKPSS